MAAAMLGWTTAKLVQLNQNPLWLAVCLTHFNTENLSHYHWQQIHRNPWTVTKMGFLPVSLCSWTLLRQTMQRRRTASCTSVGTQPLSTGWGQQSIILWLTEKAGSSGWLLQATTMASVSNKAQKVPGQGAHSLTGKQKGGRFMESLLQFLPTHCFIRIYFFTGYTSSEGEWVQLKLLKGNGADLEEMREDILWVDWKHGYLGLQSRQMVPQRC